jgi:hypothetical protein
LRDYDAITHRLLAENLASKLAREDELEAALNQAAHIGRTAAATRRPLAAKTR